MRYYIRHNKNADVLGPFTVQELVAEISGGKISPEALASSDIGDSVARLRVWRSCDWFSLADIPELRSVVPPKPQIPPEPRRVTVISIGLSLLAGLGWLYFAFTESRWFMWLLAIVMLWGAVDSIRRYARQKHQKNQAA
jgi:hypothetical protein